LKIFINLKKLLFKPGQPTVSLPYLCHAALRQHLIAMHFRGYSAATPLPPPLGAAYASASSPTTVLLHYKVSRLSPFFIFLRSGRSFTAILFLPLEALASPPPIHFLPIFFADVMLTPPNPRRAYSHGRRRPECRLTAIPAAVDCVAVHLS
jgi:hypothetical protein